MYDNNHYSIDDIVKLHPIRHYNNKLNYIVSESESYGNNSQNNVHVEYKGQHQNSTNYLKIQYTDDIKPLKTYHFTPESFLEPLRPNTQFINTTEQVQELIEETFLSITNKKLPKNLSIQVCTKQELKQIHSTFGPWNDNIQGFALNGKSKQIFVKNNHLDALILVIGHEIGHIYTTTLSNFHDEEAKAFSFAMEWAKTIKKQNIGNLADNIKDNLDFNPARNGLHDLAFFFVKNLVNKGLKPMQVHWDLVKGYISLFNFYN